MSREIKFRAWDTSSNKWVSWLKITLDGRLKDFDFDDEGRYEFEPSLEQYIIEQYTGLKDKNGIEIYEGDIVFFFTEHFDKATGGFDGEDEHNATVEWFDNGFAFMDKVPYDPNIECEIIGNIHENPELLGGEE